MSEPLESPDSQHPGDSTRRAAAFTTYALTTVARIIELRAEAEQLANALSNRLSREAPDLSEDLSYEDLVTVMRQLAEVVR